MVSDKRWSRRPPPRPTRRASAALGSPAAHGSKFEAHGSKSQTLGANLRFLDVRISRVYLTECVYLLALKSQPPHKIVNLLFTITF